MRRSPRHRVRPGGRRLDLRPWLRRRAEDEQQQDQGGEPQQLESDDDGQPASEKTDG